MASSRYSRGAFACAAAHVCILNPGAAARQFVAPRCNSTWIEARESRWGRTHAVVRGRVRCLAATHRGAAFRF
jgi:hypothetical protein